MRCNLRTLTYLTASRGIDSLMALELWYNCSEFERSIIATMARKG